MQPALIEGFESGMIFMAMLVWPGKINVWMVGMCVGVAVGIWQRVWAVVEVLGRKDRERSISAETKNH